MKGAFGFGNVQETGKSSIWGMRVFLLGFAVLMIDLCMLGLDWQIALLFLIISMICFLVLGRIIAETGMFYLSPGVYPGVLLIGIMGEQALGPTTMVILFSLTTLLFMDVRETYMPYIVNAVKFAENGSCITIRVYRDDEKAYFSVKDKGETIPEDDLPYIFDRFHKSDRSRSLDKSGVGLGLYLVKEIVNSHDEDIAVTSKDGITEFVFTLTLA